MTRPSPDAACEILSEPLRNRGTAFDHEQRHELGLTGLPAGVETLDEQAACCWA